MNDESGVFREMSVLEAQARGAVWIHFNWPFAMGYLHAKGMAPNVNLSAPIPAGPDGRATPLGWRRKLDAFRFFFVALS